MPKIIKEPVVKKGFKKFLKESDDKDQALRGCVGLFEHVLYKRIPGTSSSYRQDAGNTNTMTARHSHVYGKLNGKGAQLYAVNRDGSGHDGSSGLTIPATHADHFRSLGYAIPDTNILEWVDFDAIDAGHYSLLIVEED